MLTVTLPNLWISYRREFLVTKSVNGLLVLTQIQLGADKHDWSRWTMMAHLRKPLHKTQTHSIVLLRLETPGCGRSNYTNPLTNYCLWSRVRPIAWWSPIPITRQLRHLKADYRCLIFVNPNNEQRGHQSLRGNGGSLLSPPIKGSCRCGLLRHQHQWNAWCSSL